MKKMIGIYMAILIGILCTGCAPEHREEASIEPSSVSEAKPGELLSAFRFLHQKM
nr:hypothetical protein [uncultured Acetatifactor sp.]